MCIDYNLWWIHLSSTSRIHIFFIFSRTHFSKVTKWENHVFWQVYVLPNILISVSVVFVRPLGLFPLQHFPSNSTLFSISFLVRKKNSCVSKAVPSYRSLETHWWSTGAVIVGFELDSRGIVVALWAWLAKGNSCLRTWLAASESFLRFEKVPFGLTQTLVQKLPNDLAHKM